MAPQELVRDAVERIEPGTDLTVEATGGLPGRETLLWRVEGDATVLVMRDLGDAATRARERADLDWWVRQSRTALDEGVP